MHKSFPVIGMTCSGCANSISAELIAIDGVETASINYANQIADVKYNESKVTPQSLQKALQAIGFDLIISEDNPLELQEDIQKKQNHDLKLRTIGSWILSIPVMILSMFFMDYKYTSWVSLVLSTPVIFYFGRFYFINAIKKARHFNSNMDTLVALSTGIAFCFSFFNTIWPEYWHHQGLHAHIYYEAAVMIISFVSLGKFLEEKAKFQTYTSIRKLIGLQPKKVKVIIEEQEVELLIAQVQEGQIIKVHPGDRIPVDGIIYSGKSYIDESMISGEALPVFKNKGDKVISGSLNQNESFLLIAEKIGQETFLSGLIKMVQEAQGSKAPIQKLVDRISGIFVPVILLLSLLTFIIWIVFGSDNALPHAILSSVSVLVIACPCALGLATPTAIMVGVGLGAEHHILIKNAESLEVAYKVDTVILDKTGTITEGKPQIGREIWRNDLKDVEKFKSLLYSAENHSTHPLAQALVSHYQSFYNSNWIVENIENIPGYGLVFYEDNIKYLIGTERLLKENNIKLNENLINYAVRLEQQAHTIIYFANQSEHLAVISITDKIKSGSAQAIKTLIEAGIDVYMLTGDNEYTAKVVAADVGIKNFRSKFLPLDKLEFIKNLQTNGKVVAMVGDGINDSPALAQSDVGIAMGRGSDITIDIAKITLITSDLNAVPKTFSLSKLMMRGIRQNLFWAFIYNVIGIPLAAGILFPINGFLLNPMVAGAAMAFSSVSVVMNSLRLKRIKI